MEWKKLGSLARFSFLVFGNLLSPCLHRPLRSGKESKSQRAARLHTPQWGQLLPVVHSKHTRLNGAAGEPTPLSWPICWRNLLFRAASTSSLFLFVVKARYQKSCFHHPRAHWIYFLPPAQCNHYQQSVMHLPMLAEVQATGNCIVVGNATITWAPCLAVTGFILPICRLLVLYHLQPAFSLVLVFSQDDMFNWFE